MKIPNYRIHSTRPRTHAVDLDANNNLKHAC